ncbi:MAG: DUF167 domain-containing protein [Verrucomicrobiales bacterium]|nr:DUF167 domain-containing protein [Verrucomicrobiales bacterium]
MALPSFLQATPNGTLVRLKVQPRASRNEVGPPNGEELKIRVTAPPVDSAANQAVCELLADTLGCRRGAVQLVRGASSRHKNVEINGLIPDEVLKRLEAAGS